jgi:hypothetical protein
MQSLNVFVPQGQVCLLNFGCTTGENEHCLGQGFNGGGGGRFLLFLFFGYDHLGQDFVAIARGVTIAL